MLSFQSSKTLRETGSITGINWKYERKKRKELNYLSIIYVKVLYITQLLNSIYSQLVQVSAHIDLEYTLITRCKDKK